MLTSFVLILVVLPGLGWMGVFEEQPIPLNFTTICGGMTSSHSAHERRRHRIVPAARAQRRRGALVAHGQHQPESLTVTEQPLPPDAQPVHATLHVL